MSASVYQTPMFPHAQVGLAPAQPSIALQGKGEAIRSKLYGKMGKLIIQAVRAAGPDPVANTQLRDLIAQVHGP